MFFRRYKIQKWLVVMLLTTSSAFAQSGNLMIRVMGEGAPVEYAAVRIPHLHTGALTDSTGTVWFYSVMPGAYEVEIVMPGYQPSAQTIEVTAQSRRFSIELTPSVLDETVITGSMKAMRKSESIVPVDIYTPRFFARNPTPSLFEAMSAVNGVRPQLQCAVCNTGDIHINGMEGPYTMVLIDGMPIVSGLSTVYGLSGIPNGIVERVEVVKGPAAALYGSEAMGGVINVVTKSPLQAPRFSADLSGTTYEEWNADLAFSRRVGAKAHTLLSGNFFHFDRRFDLNSDNFTDIALAKRFSIFNKWSFKQPYGRFATIAARFLNENRFGGELQWRPVFAGGDSIYGETIQTRRYELIAQYPLPFEREKLLLQVSANRHEQDSYYGIMPYFADQNIIFSQLTWEKTLYQRHQLLAGASRRYTWYDDNTSVTAAADLSRNQPQIKNLTGCFVQDEYAPNARLKAVIGLRYDYSNVHKHIFSPRAGMKFQYDPFNTFRLNAGNGFRAVNVFSEDHAALTGGRRVIFAHQLQPERSWNANLNYTRFQSLPSGFVNMDFSLFYTYFNNKIVADYFTNSQLVIYDNLSGYGENYGVSFNSDWNFDFGLKSTIGLTWLQSYTVENHVRQRPIQTPPFTANYSASYSLSRFHIDFDFNGYVNGAMLLPVLPNDYRPSRSPFFNVSNVQITRKWLQKRLECYGGVKNLFNFYPKEDVVMRAFDPFDKRIQIDNPNGYTFDPSYNYAPLQGIRLFVGLRIIIP